MARSLWGEPAEISELPTLRVVLPSLLGAGLAFSGYLWTAAPDLTWAYFGADGGELMAAAVTTGVAHPPGYPLYILLLRTWIIVGRFMMPTVEIAQLGNWLSAFLGAASIPPVIITVHRFSIRTAQKWQIPLLSGLLWAFSPLLWQQALIAEVYTLHIALVAWLGYLLLTGSLHPLWLAVTIGLGLANHGTVMLLLPAVYYRIATHQPNVARRIYLAPLAGIALAAGIYLYIPLAASAQPPPPVNWGYADHWNGLIWLMSGAAYRQYLFAVPWPHIPGRVAGWAMVSVTQYSAIGLAIALLGLAEWDRKRPSLRTFSLLWILPVSMYAIMYNTQDSHIYLLPATLLCAIWLGVGANWLVFRLSRHERIMVLSAVGLSAMLLVLIFTRMPNISLRHQSDARLYLSEVAHTLTAIQSAPLVVSSTDRQTFALWYGAWASGELLRLQPDLVLVNRSLFQYEWYRRLLLDLHPSLTTVESDFFAFIHRQHPLRPILFTEPLPGEQSSSFEPIGSLWQYAP